MTEPFTSLPPHMEKRNRRKRKTNKGEITNRSTDTAPPASNVDAGVTREETKVGLGEHYQPVVPPAPSTV